MSKQQTIVQCARCRVAVPIASIAVFDRCMDKACPLNELHPSAPAQVMALHPPVPTGKLSPIPPGAGAETVKGELL